MLKKLALSSLAVSASGLVVSMPQQPATMVVVQQSGAQQYLSAQPSVLATSSSAIFPTSSLLAANAKIEAAKDITLEKHLNPCVVAYSDAAWNVRRDGSSQGGYLVFLTDLALLQNREAPLSLLSWASAKLTRVCRSSSAAEVELNAHA